MKKFVLSSVLALGVFSWGSALGADSFVVPERFEGYKDSRFVKNDMETILGMPFFVRYYDIEGDGVNDVAEIRPVSDVSGEPLYYGFDDNGDGVFAFSELVHDPKRDGLGGNERPYCLSLS